MRKVKILRQQTSKTMPYWESFLYDGPEDNTVAGLLDYINYNDDIMNDQGEKTTRVDWECSCMQGMCGACAMVINDVPALACEVFIRDLEGEEITIRPLTKFPTIHDLVVDRSSIQENMRQNNIFIGEYRPPQDSDDKEHRHQYDVAKCLKCGLCLEVCPQYVDGGDFFGATFANDCFLAATRNQDQSDEIGQTYREHFKGSCKYDLACMRICPMKIRMTVSMAVLNKMKPSDTGRNA